MPTAVDINTGEIFEDIKQLKNKSYVIKHKEATFKYVRKTNGRGYKRIGKMRWYIEFLVAH